MNPCQGEDFSALFWSLRGNKDKEEISKSFFIILFWEMAQTFQMKFQNMQATVISLKQPNSPENVNPSGMFCKHHLKDGRYHEIEVKVPLLP